MRHLAVLSAVTLLAAACSDAGVSPTSPDGLPTTIRASHTTGAPVTDQDPCPVFDGEGAYLGSASPCDGYQDYWHKLSEPGVFITSPGVNNHKPFSGDFVRNLTGQLQVYTCPITSQYPPDDLSKWNGFGLDVNCSQGTNEFDGKFRWPDPIEGDEIYRTDLQFKLRGAAKKQDPRPAFRIYLVAGERHLAHRDISLCTSDFSPADGGLYCAGTGTIPFKFYVGTEVGCKKFDSNEFDSQDSAVCLLTGDLAPLTLDSEFTELSATLDFAFQDPIDAFIAKFNLTECESLGPSDFSTTGRAGSASMDLRFLGCKLTIVAPDDAELTNAATVTLDILENDCDVSGPGCVIVLQDDAGQSMLPVPPPSPVTLSPLRNFLGAGLNKLAALVGAKPLVATAVGGSSLSGSFRRLSDIQAAVRTVVDFPGGFGDPCASGSASCRDLGTVTGPTLVRVKATAPGFVGGIPGVRFHFFPDDGGTAACLPSATDCYAGVPDPTTDPVSPTTWLQTVVITDINGDAEVDWTLGAGGRRAMKILVCGGAIPGSDTPQDDNVPTEQAGDFVWGVLQTCDREATDVDADPRYDTSDGVVDANGWANGPIATAVDPFDPNFDTNTTFEVAANDLPLTVLASGCPTPDVRDGTRINRSPAIPVDEWPDDCVGSFDFIASVTGKTLGTPNATLMWTNDGEFLYVGVEVRGVSAKDLNDAFFDFDNDAAGATDRFLPPDTDGDSPGVQYSSPSQEFDDLVLLRVGQPAEDWWKTAQCAGSEGKTLCGLFDTAVQDADGAAAVDPVTGDLFWEFKKPLNKGEENCLAADQEDFCVFAGDYLGVSGTITGGKGGSKGGNSGFPGFQVYQLIKIK